jgi:tRNA nucleotidyltransferase (CCA-adding enzyme)
MKIYLVGGYVRDELLGRCSKDKDYVIFDCSEKEFFKKFPYAKKVGKKIPVYLVGRDEYTISEFSNIYEDLMSRDLTINAIAKDMEGNIYAHPRALEDLKNKILRAISLENFIKDPLRVHRAARFAAQFPDFSVDPELLNIMNKVGGSRKLMEKISKERVAQEVIKAISAEKPSRFFSLLIKTKAISYWFEEIEKLEKNNKWIDIIEKVGKNEIRVWMALSYGFYLNLKDKNNALFYLKEMSRRIGLPKVIQKAGISFLEFYEQGIHFFFLSPSEIRDLIYILEKRGYLFPFFEVIEKITQKNI